MNVRQAKAKSIFQQAAEINAIRERRAFVNDACAGDDALRLEVDDLLRHLEDLGSFLESTAIPAATLGAYEIGEHPGTVIGPYTLVEQLGEGGMGLVFRAEQSHPVRRQVALKVIQPGLDGRQVIARFEAERQALALMDHPNIARVLDAGESASSTAGGPSRPYFVMELVHGIPISDYCEQNQLGVRARLALFESVCHAVQHAHQKGIIHRDLKPMNVLVTTHDGTPMPKVIDFGVAKALGQPLTDGALVTHAKQLIGTPTYMSPEQAGMNAADVDTRSDIYSLGVMLYELLTGTTPVERSRLRELDIDEVRRIVREEEPPKPSTRLNSLASQPTCPVETAARARQLSRTICGEPDWIAMKCLEKDRDRRYDTAAALAADVRRYLNGEPIMAGPPGAGYQIRKFLGRHQAVVTATALVAATLLIGIVMTSWQAVVAERARATAAEERDQKETARKEAVEAGELARKRLEQIVRTNEILTGLFAGLEPATENREGVSLRTLLERKLDQAAGQLNADAIGDPMVLAQMQDRIGRAQIGLGRPQKAIPLLERARATSLQLNGPNHLDTLAISNNLAGAFLAMGQLAEAVQLLEAVCDGRIKALGQGHPKTMSAMGNLANVYRNLGRPADAARMFELVRDVQVKANGPEHAITLVTSTNLAAAYRDAGRFDEAIKLFEQVRATQLKTLGADHFNYWSTCNNLGLTYRYIGRKDDALKLFDEVSRLQSAARGADNPVTLATRNQIGATYLALNRIDEAIREFEDVQKAHAVQVPADDPTALSTRHNLGVAYRAAGRANEAVALLEQIAATRASKYGAGHPDALESLSELAMSLIDAGAYAPAESCAERLLGLWAAKDGDSWQAHEAQTMVGAALAGQKKFAEAEPLLLQGINQLIQHREAIPNGIRRACLTRSAARLVHFYEACGKPVEAAKWRAVTGQ